MITEIAIIAFFFIVSLFSSLPHILQLQLAEYLLYRYRAMILDTSLSHMLFPKISMPAKSMRNLLIFAFVGLGLLLYSIAVYFTTTNPVWITILSALMYFLAKVLVLFGSILTSPIAWFLRYRRIYIAKRQINNSGVKIIGITGSYGKSSVKEILHRLLSTKYLTGKTRANHNTDVGIGIEAGLQVTPHTQYFIAEMGAYRNGDIAKLCRLYKPSIGVVTGVGNQHVSLFGSVEHIKKTKLEMVDGVKGGPVYVNIDWPKAWEYLKKNGYDKKDIITYGESYKADARIVEIRKNDGITVFTVKYDGKKETYKTRLLGKHNVVNIFPAIMIARHLGMSYSEVASALLDIEPVLGKLSIHDSSFGFRILNDGYNSNVNGFLAALDVLNDMKEKKKFVSTRGLFELGKHKVKAYEKILKRAAELKMVILTTDKEMVIERYKESVKLFESENDILSYLRQLNTKDSILLLEGRHGFQFTYDLGLTKVY